MYHSISDDPLDPWAVSQRVFAAEMDWVAKHEYSVLSLQQALEDLYSERVRKKTIVLTFDDGFVDFLENAVPILSKYRFAATLFIVASEVGSTSRWRSPELQSPLLGWEDIQHIAKIGFEIGSHGLYHRDLTTLDSEDLEKEINLSKNLIEDYVGASVNSFSYPWGAHNVREINAVRKAGYNCAVTISGKWENNPETDRYRLQRKTMSRADSLDDFVRSVYGHEQFYTEVRSIIATRGKHMLNKVINHLKRKMVRFRTRGSSFL